MDKTTETSAHETDFETVRPPLARPKIVRRSRRLFALGLALAGVAYWQSGMPLSETVIHVTPPQSQISTKPITHESGGVVGAIKVAPGQNVKAGQVLMTVDGADVVAPSDGTVIDLLVEQPGSTVAPGAVLISFHPTAVLVLEI